MNQLKPQIHTRTTMIQQNLQIQSKDSLSKNHCIIIYSTSRIDINIMTKNPKKRLSFEQNQSRNVEFERIKIFQFMISNFWKILENPAARSEY